MDESSTRELEGLRALLSKFGPSSVFGAIAVLCDESAHQTATLTGDSELWECAASAARDAAVSLHAGDTEDLDGDAEPTAQDAACSASADCTDATPEAGAQNDDNDDETNRGAATPADERPALEEEPRAVRRAPPERTTMKEQRLGPRPVQATHWRCFRVVPGKRNRAALSCTVNGFGTNEWAIKSCSAETIAQRWGDGNYIVQYIQIDGAAKRRPVGRSKMLSVTGRSSEAPALPHDAAPAALATTSAKPIQATLIPSAHGAGGSDATLAGLLSLLTFMQEQQERSRASILAEARLLNERHDVSATARREHHRDLLKFDLERTKLEKEEKIAHVNAEARMASRGGRAELEALHAKLDALMTKVEEIETADDDDDDASAPVVAQAAPDPMTRFITFAETTLAPLLMTLAANLTKPPAPPAPVPEGGPHGPH